MSKKLSVRAGLAISISVATLTGCSSFVQQAAPVESPSQTSAYRVEENKPVAVATSESDSAQATPYRESDPVRASSTQVTAARPVSADDGKTHVVQPGENLYRISLSHGLKYQVVASWNNLPDFNIKTGQVLRLTPPSGQATEGQVTAPPAQSGVAVSSPSIKPYPKGLKLAYSAAAVQSIAAQSEGNRASGQSSGSTIVKTESSAAQPVSVVPIHSARTASEAKSSSDASAPKASLEDEVSWAWPATGKLLRGFSDSNKGADIGGRMGQPILAAGNGKVVYSGSGLRGYGKLIIIKHNKTFLSAYAHNSQLLVKEGQSVKKGQKIAEMGNTDADQVKLHFEIRRFGKPVDPMQYLNSKP